MKALLGHLGVERAVIGGLSLGGYVSLGFALEHPQMTRALVICDSGPGYRSAEAREAWNARARERAVSLETRGLEALGKSREVQESASLHRSAQGLAHAARGMLAQEGSRVIDGLAVIRVPTLIIVGDQDQPFLAPCEYMAKKIPGARLEVIRGAGHSSNLDQPEAFNRVLLDFLDGLAARLDARYCTGEKADGSMILLAIVSSVSLPPGGGHTPISRALLRTAVRSSRLL